MFRTLSSFLPIYIRQAKAWHLGEEWQIESHFRWQLWVRLSNRGFILLRVRKKDMLLKETHKQIKQAVPYPLRQS